MWKSKSTGNFYPRPPRGGRLNYVFFFPHSFQFLSTPSARRATPAPARPRRTAQFLSTPSARRATGGDIIEPGAFTFLSTPSARRATCVAKTSYSDSRFLSTPSARRATAAGLAVGGDLIDFYPRPPRGGRRASSTTNSRRRLFLSTPSARRATDQQAEIDSYLEISIHALREEGDVHPQSVKRGDDISIHALREEGDPPWNLVALSFIDFYPRPPRGGRRPAHSSNTLPVQFLSTPSARRATVSASTSGAAALNFYPRPPRGGRPPNRSARCWRYPISIHALREEGDILLPTI